MVYKIYSNKAVKKKKKKQTPCLWKGPLLLPNAEALASISMTKGIEQS